jgi:hypothetical protein
MYVDYSGRFAITSFIVGILVAVLISVVIGAAMGGLYAAASGTNIWMGALFGAIGGLISGVTLVAAGVLFEMGGWFVLLAFGIAFAGGFAGNLIQYSMNQIYYEDDLKWDNAIISGAIGGIKSFIMLPIGAFANFVDGAIGKFIEYGFTVVFEGITFIIDLIRYYLEEKNNDNKKKQNLYNSLTNSFA